MRNIKSKDKERKNNLNKLKIITILVVIFTIGFAIYCYINYDSNKKSLLDNGYVEINNGDFKKYITGSEEVELDKDKLPYNVSYYTIKNDYSSISYFGEWIVDNKEHYFYQLHNYEYNYSSNIAKGTFMEELKKGDFNAYNASYDFNNSKLLCDASQSDCNRFVQELMKLKEEYNSVINNK